MPWNFIRTYVLVVKLQEITFLVQLVRMAVEEGEDGQQLRDGIFGDVHEVRCVGLHHRQRARGTSLPLLQRGGGALGWLYGRVGYGSG